MAKVSRHRRDLARTIRLVPAAATRRKATQRAVNGYGEIQDRRHHQLGRYRRGAQRAWYRDDARTDAWTAAAMRRTLAFSLSVLDGHFRFADKSSEQQKAAEREETLNECLAFAAARSAAFDRSRLDAGAKAPMLNQRHHQLSPWLGSI